MTPTTQKNTTPPLTVVPIPRKGIKGAAGILLYVLLTLSCLILPLGVSVLTGKSFFTPTAAEAIFLLYLILLAVYFSRTGKLVGKGTRGITPLLIFVTLITCGMTGSFIPAAVIFALFFAIGEGAVLVASATSLQGWLSLLIPTVSAGLSLFLCRDFSAMALALLPCPAALTLALCTRASAGKETGLTRVGVICATSLAFGVTLLGLAAWALYEALGTLQLSELKEALESLRVFLIQALMSYEISSGDTVILSLADKEAEVTNVVNSMINTLPGTLVVLCNVVAAFAQMITLSGLKAYGFGDSVTDRVKEFRISVVSAVIFLLSWLVALVAVGDNNASTVIGTVAENFFIVLTPGLALAGIFRFARSMAARMGCGFFILIAFTCFVLYVPPIVALYEAVSLILSPILAKRKTHAAKKKERAEFEEKNKPSSDEDRFDAYCREQERRRKEEEDRQNHDDDHHSDHSENDP